MNRSPTLDGRCPVPAGRAGPADTRPPAAPDPERLVALVARVFLEVEAGRRPLSQLEPLLAPSLYARLRRSTHRPHRCRGPVEVRSTGVSRTGPDTCDAAVVVRRGARAGSLALRLERRGGAWRVVELARPEDHGSTYQRPALVVRR